MTIPATIREDMTTAWKAGETRRRDTLRLLIAALDNARIEARHDLSDEESLAVLQRQAKQRQESIVEYRKGAREDLVEVEVEELAIISGYLPEALSDDELHVLVRAVIGEVGASGPGDLGSVMRPLMQRAAGRADGKRASEIVRELLASG